MRTQSCGDPQQQFRLCPTGTAMDAGTKQPSTGGQIVDPPPVSPIYSGSVCVWICMVETQWVEASVLHRRAWMGTRSPNGRRPPTPLTNSGALEALISGVVVPSTNRRRMDRWNPPGPSCRVINRIFLALGRSEHPCLLVVSNESNGYFCNQGPFVWNSICVIDWNIWFQDPCWMVHAFHGYRWWCSPLVYSAEGYRTAARSHRHAFPLSRRQTVLGLVSCVTNCSSFFPRAHLLSLPSLLGTSSLHSKEASRFHASFLLSSLQSSSHSFVAEFHHEATFPSARLSFKYG